MLSGDKDNVFFSSLCREKQKITTFAPKEHQKVYEKS